MNITLDNNINRLTFENSTQNYKGKSITENEAATCSNSASGVILELSKEATQEGFVRVKEEVESTTSDTEQVANTRALTTSQIQDFQTRLRALGFYTGAQDGNPVSSEFKKAVSNFQKTYGCKCWKY